MKNTPTLGAWRSYVISNPGQEPVTITIKGRNLWALEQLVQAGTKGCTPMENPAPRWSAYIHNLRKFGIQIRTITEQHGGNFAGNHGRYVLVAEVALAIGGAM